jgi:signal transduction histidine kinase
MQFINSAADKMKLLLDELLELSRIDRIEKSPVSVSFKELVSEVLATLAGSIKERNVVTQLTDSDVMLYGDRQRLYQVFQNLIENAIKYCSDVSTPRIEVGIQPEGADTVFYVKDNGIGIDPQYQSKIFGIFEKIDQKSPGGGLGLTLVKRIVEKYGGRIWVESEGNGRGSSFLFTLPHAVLQKME